MTNTRILVFGDSIAYGSWAEYGWVELLKHELHQRTIASGGATKMQVLNLGISGDSSTKILNRMEAEIAARHSASWPFALIFSFGTNDQRVADGQPETSIKQFEANSKAIIAEARIHTDTILFVGTPPVGQPVAMLKGKEYADQRVREYEERLKAVVAAENVPFVPIRPVFEQADRASLYAFDGLHPGDAGHQLIAATVLPELDKLLGH